MCGIAGLIKKNSYSNNIDKSKILELMSSRGPDDNGFFTSKTKNCKIDLFHSRLAIIDTQKRSRQPFKYKNLTLVYNGEIYNFKEIRNELKKNGYIFNTESDTEVVIKAYDKWKEKCVKKFDGMWSICIFDQKKEEIFLSRDPFGEKPLFYYLDNSKFIFGSEIKYILKLDAQNSDLKKINFNQIDLYLKQGYKFLNKKNHTFFKNIFKFDSGTYALLNLNTFRIIKKKFLKKKGYDLERPISYKDAVLKTKKLVIETLGSRLISDVPIGFYLSGGVDSGSLASIATKVYNQKITCFSIIDKDQRYNEEKNVDKVTNDLNCNTIKINFPQKHDFFERLDKLVDYHDSPIATPSYYTLSFIHDEVKKYNIKVLISGLGGDEIFSGYFDHYLMHLKEIEKDKKNYNKNLDNWKKYILPYIRNKNLRDLNLFKNKKNRKYLECELDENFINKYLKNNKVIKFTEGNYSKSLMKNRMLNEIFNESVPVICQEDDLNSMMQSIENRCPLLNKKLLEFTMSLPPKMFISNGYNKSLFRDSMQGILTDDVRLDRKKFGFNASINSLVNLKSKRVQSVLNNNKDINEFINVRNFKSLISNNKEFDNNESKFIFNVFNVISFLEKNPL